MNAVIDQEDSIMATIAQCDTTIKQSTGGELISLRASEASLHHTIDVMHGDLAHMSKELKQSCQAL